MNNDKNIKPQPSQQQSQTQTPKKNGVDGTDGAGVRFVPSEESAKIEATPETAQKQNAHH